MIDRMMRWSQRAKAYLRIRTRDKIRKFRRSRYLTIPWIIGVGSTLVLVAAVVTIVLVPNYSVPGSLSPDSTRLELVNEYRKTTATIWGAALVLIGAAIAAWRVKIAGQQVQATRQGEINDRYTRAIDQLGKQNEKDGTPHVVVRLGGIYALERIALEPPQQYFWQILEVLCAFVRAAVPVGSGSASRCPEDVKAAVAVIFRMKRPLGSIRVLPDLSHTELNSVILDRLDLWGAKFVGSILMHADYTGCGLLDIDFSDAKLSHAKFVAAELEEVTFDGADLSDASFERSEFFCTTFRRANLSKASFKNAVFIEKYVGEHGYGVPGADFTDSTIDDTDLCGLDLVGVRGLTWSMLVTAKIDEQTRLPDGKKGVSQADLASLSEKDRHSIDYVASDTS